MKKKDIHYLWVRYIEDNMRIRKRTKEDKNRTKNKFRFFILGVQNIWDNISYFFRRHLISALIIVAVIIISTISISISAYNNKTGTKHASKNTIVLTFDVKGQADFTRQFSKYKKLDASHYKTSSSFLYNGTTKPKNLYKVILTYKK